MAATASIESSGTSETSPSMYGTRGSSLNPWPFVHNVTANHVIVLTQDCCIFLCRADYLFTSHEGWAFRTAWSYGFRLVVTPSAEAAWLGINRSGRSPNLPSFDTCHQVKTPS